MTANNSHKAIDASGVVLAALMIQRLPCPEVDEGLAEDAWREAVVLSSTATSDELLDTVNYWLSYCTNCIMNGMSHSSILSPCVMPAGATASG